MNGLPVEFENRMKEMLGEEYEAYLESFGQERRYGLRVNRLKLSPEELAQLVPFPVKPISWVDNGYFYNGEDSPARGFIICRNPAP